MDNQDIIKELESAIITGLQMMKNEEAKDDTQFKESLTALQSIITITITLDERLESITICLLASVSLILLGRNVAEKLGADFSEKVAVMLMLQRILGGGDG